MAAYFKANQATYNHPPQVRARQILVSDPQTAQQIEEQLKAGADFATLAKQNSIDAGTREFGGEIGWFARGKMLKVLDRAAWSQPVGVVGPPLRSPLGYHIVEVEEHRPAFNATIASVHDDIVKELTREREQKLMPKLLAQISANAKIVVHDPHFASMYPPRAASLSQKP